jgi:23S rRNA pseudouridine955/2504/2580 synthase
MNAPKLQTRTVTEDEAGIRLDRWFRRHYPDTNQGQLQKWLRTGQVRVGGKRAETSLRLEAGQEIRVPPQVTAPKPAGLVTKDKDRDAGRLKKMILFEDDDVIILNKAPGLAVQGGTGLKENLDDMVSALAKQGQSKPKLVHRLDRDTSGVLVLARNAYAASKLTEAFRERDTQKIYWGVTVNVPKPARGRIDAPLIKKGELMEVAPDDDEEAKSAATLYQVVESAKGQAAFVAMWPLTGRTHQLRVHMALLKTPLLGDPLYGREAATLPEGLGKGLHLHARRLIIPHPRRGMIDAIAPLPPAMKKTWDWFGFDANADVQFDDA